MSYGHKQHNFSVNLFVLVELVKLIGNLILKFFILAIKRKTLIHF